MKHLVKPYLTLFPLLALLSCGQQNGQDIPAETDTTAATDTSAAALPADPIFGERINGPAPIRDTVNGAILFTLNDSTLVTSSEEQNGWYTVGLHAELPLSAYGTDTLRKGQKIVVGGKVVGEVVKDFHTSTSSTGKETWAELTGYTPKDNINPATIIENVLHHFAARVPDRSLQAYQPFINSFRLERDEELSPFVTFFTHESWIDDPSPLLRIQLIFEANKLIGVVHSRPLRLPGTTDYELERDLRAAFYDDTPGETRDSFISRFNAFISSVD